jgi:hypothetical protein
MAFGRKKDPIVELERERNDLVARRDVLEQKFDRAHAALAAATNERRTSLLDADLSDEEACRRRDQLCRDAKDRVEALGDATSQIGSKIADMEAKVVELRAEAEKSEHTREIRAAIAPLADARNEAAAGLRKTLDTARALAAKVPVNPDFIPQLNSIAETFLAATGELFETAERHAAGVMNGASLPVRPSPPPPSEPPVPEIDRLRIYTLANLKWCERGQVMTAPRYAWATPPRAVSETAIARNLADLPGRERTERLIAGFGVHNGPVPGDMCIDLDCDPPAEEQPRALPPSFEERIGPVRPMQISVNRQ